MLKLVLALFIMTFVLKRFSSILHRMNKKLCEREGCKFSIQLLGCNYEGAKFSTFY